MSREKILVLLFFCPFLLLPQTVIAKVSLSEFQIEPDQWVELYNDASESADISGWTIDDSGGSEKFTIDLNTQIASFSYQVFHSGKFNLNKSEDTVNLFDNNSNLLESFSYNKSPGENISLGKTTDNSWGICQPTQGGVNNCYVPSPTPTPSFTPSPTPIPTATTKPSATATFSPTPKITADVTKTPASEKPEISNSPSPTIDILLPVLSKTSLPSISTPKQEQKNLPYANDGQDNQPIKKTLFWLMVLVGALFIAGSAVLFYTAKTK